MSLIEWIDNKVNELMLEYHVPGLAISIVKDNQVLCSKGYGYRSIEEKLMVNEDTVFPIASVTKTFTATLASIILEEQNIPWTSKVKDVIPELEFKDKNISELANLIDLAAHRTGMFRHDMFGLHFRGSRKEFIENIKYLNIYGDFRTEARYQNQMYTALGYLPEIFNNMTWEDCIKEKIFKPLDMDNSYIYSKDMQNTGNYVKPYKYIDGSIVDLTSWGNEYIQDVTDNSLNETIIYKDALDEHFVTKGQAPAGKIKSCIKDMTNYMIMHLNDGQYKSNQIISKEVSELMKKPHVICNQPFFYYEDDLVHYGLGWFIHNYRGHKAYGHTGNCLGVSTIVRLFPNENIGICILTNLHATDCHKDLLNIIADKILEIEEVDWVNKRKQIVSKVNTNKISIMQNKLNNSNLTCNFDDYLGNYHCDGYGNLHIVEKNNCVYMNYYPFKFIMENISLNEFQIYVPNFDSFEKVIFEVNSKNEITKLIWYRPIDGGGTIEFNKIM